jgi:hypothetical protein
MMTDDEVAGAVETLTELTKDGELHWTRSAEGRLSTDELEGFTVTVTEIASKYELEIDDGGSERAAYVSATQNVDLSVQMKLYQLYMLANDVAGTDAARRFQEAARKRAQPPRRG